MRDTSRPVVEAEQEAIRRCKAGETDAFRIIVERYGDVLYGTAYLMLGDRGQAEDAVQEAFVSGWRGIGTFDPGPPLRPWLIQILVNHVRQRRRRKLLRLIPLTEMQGPFVSAEMSPESAAEKAWERREIRTALAALPADAARIVVLRFFAELSLAEVAETLDVPVGTVKSRLHRALQKLRAELPNESRAASVGHRDRDPHDEKEAEV